MGKIDRVDFWTHIAIPGPFNSFNGMNIGPHGASAFCGSITGMFVERGCVQSQGLQVNDEPKAVCGATPGVTASES